MRIKIDDIIVWFPYDYMYSEQYEYMCYLKQTLDAGSGHCLLEMPTGTGKTVCLLSLILSYQVQNSDVGKLVYCTRTVQEMDKAMEEAERVIDFISRASKREGFPEKKHLCVCLSARKNTCIHPEVSAYEVGGKVDAMCRNLTSSWVREKNEEEDSTTSPVCEYYENFVRDFESRADDPAISGVYPLEKLKEKLGKEKGYCPYFSARHLIAFANVVVFNYQYMLDPKVSSMVAKNIQKECIVVFDEAHNIDNICIEALSVEINKRTLVGADRNIKQLQREVARVEREDMERLTLEYQQLINGLASTGAFSEESRNLLANPVLPEDLLKEAVPGNIRKARHFLTFLRIIVEHLKKRLAVKSVVQEDTRTFLKNFILSAKLRDVQTKALKFTHDRLQSLFRTLRSKDLQNYQHIQRVCNLCSLVSTYNEGFMVITEPYATHRADVYDPIMRLNCLDASIAMQPVFKKFRNVIITSGTLSPVEFYPKMLKFQPKLAETLPMSLSRKCICPIIVSKGNDQVPISSRFESRGDAAVIKNYGDLAARLASVIPDGIICFFVSYRYMSDIITAWSEMNILTDILKHKLLFIESKDVLETGLALEAYRNACDVGRGAVFFAVARGKVAEGVDFDGHYGRAVIMFGVPFQYSKSRPLLARMDFLRENYDIPEADFMNFDALRQASQCMGRVIRSKTDYGLMILADSRYTRNDKRKKLPKWISQHLQIDHMNLSVEMAVQVARDFCLSMAQPHNIKDEIGVTLLSAEEVTKKKVQQVNNSMDIEDLL